MRKRHSAFRFWMTTRKTKYFILSMSPPTAVHGSSTSISLHRRESSGNSRARSRRKLICISPEHISVSSSQERQTIQNFGEPKTARPPESEPKNKPYGTPDSVTPCYLGNPEYNGRW